MDSDKIKAMADAAEKGYEIEYDSPEEAKAVEKYLQLKSGGQPMLLGKQEPTHLDKMDPAQAEKIGATPSVADYSPLLRNVDPRHAVNGENAGGFKHFQNATGNSTQAIAHLLSALDQIDKFMPGTGSKVLSAMGHSQDMADIDANKKTRAVASVDQPAAYNLGRAEGGAITNIAGGALLGPSAAAQGMAGMVSALAQDMSPTSGLGGAAAGYGMGRLLGTGKLEAGLEKLSPHGLEDGSTIGDQMLARYLGLKPEEIVKLKASGELDDILGVVRGNSEFPYMNPQETLENINLEPTQMGSRGSLGNPSMDMPAQQPIGKIKAEMSAMPTQQPNPGAWTPQPGPPKEIVLGGKYGPNDNPGWHTDNLYKGATAEELNSINPAGPAASRGPYGPWAGRQIPPPAPQQVDLDVYHPYSPAEPPPLSPPERAASAGLAHAASQKDVGMVPSTFAGGMQQMFMQRAAAPTSIGVPKVAERMLQMIQSPAAQHLGGAMKSAASASLRPVIEHVMSSADPSFSDYLAKETFPEYLALSKRAQKELEDNKDDKIPEIPNSVPPGKVMH